MNTYPKTNTFPRHLASAGSRPVVLLVGGTDPSGGAGLFADARAVAAMGGHGCFALTAVTVQDSGRVHSWSRVDPGLLRAQLNAVCNDGTPDGVKTGMLGSPEAVEIVSEIYRSAVQPAPLVVDPVLAAGSGDSLASGDLSECILRTLVPIASLLTPNLDEAEALTKRSVRTIREMEEAGRALLEAGSAAVLVKGGHLDGAPSDVLVTENGVRIFTGERIIPGKVHGTGCTLASACAALMASGYTAETAVEKALSYLRGAIRDGFRRNNGFLIGHFPGIGPGPCPGNTTSFYAPPRFCHVCGGSLVGVSGHMACSGCGLVYYRNPLPAVMVIVSDKEGRLLLVRRTFAPARGELCFPGGFMEIGETPVECARRELFEETGLSAESMELAGSDSDTTDYGAVALYIFRTQGYSGTPVPGDDAAEILWLHPADIPPLAFAAHNRALIGTLRGDGLR